MDFIKHLFKSSNYSQFNASNLGLERNIKSTESFNENPFMVLDSKLKQLEDINFSPLPQSKEDRSIVNFNILNSLIKIIFNLDTILQDKLKKKSSINHSSNNLHIYNNAIKGVSNISYEESHYWNFLIRHFTNLESVKFINNYLHDKAFANEKGLAWISIIVFEKKFYEFLVNFYKSDFAKKYYETDSLVIEKQKELLDFAMKLMNVSFHISIGIFEEYSKFKIMQNKQVDNENDIDISELLKKKSTVLRKISGNNLNQNDNSTSQNLTPLQIANEGKTSKFNISQLNLNSNTLATVTIINHPNVSCNNANINGEVYKMNSNLLLSGINPNFYESKQENPNCNSFGLIELNNLFNNGILGEEEYFIDTVIRKDSQLTKDGNQEDQSRKRKDTNEIALEYSISKYLDLANCLKEYFFNFPDKNNKISKTMLNHPIEKYFRVNKKHDKNIFTKKDVVYFNNKHLKMNNSLLFYLNHYFLKTPFFKFQTGLKQTLPHTLESQNNQCHFCLKKFEKFLFLSTSNVFWCSYYMRYACDECISSEYSIIPGFILKKWNFKKYSISVKAKLLLNNWFNKPIIHIKPNDSSLKISFRLRQAIILKRKIHKIFDLMKCEGAEKFVIDTMDEYKYLVLKQNLFSMKDLCDINDYLLIYKLQNMLKSFEDHILRSCVDCNYKGGSCVVCANNEILLAYDIEKVFYCEDCKVIYHKDCGAFHPCIINK